MHKFAPPPQLWLHPNLMDHKLTKHDSTLPGDAFTVTDFLANGF